MPFAQARGARLHYEVTGTGVPLLFVHETGTDLRSWENQVRWFSRFHQCITYNVRGYRPSERGADPSTHDYLQLQEDIGCVMDAAGVEKAFVVGLSMGAYFSVHFAMNQPERLLGLVLVGLGAGSDDPQAFRAGNLATAEALRREGTEAMARHLAELGNRVQLRTKDERGWAEFLQQLREQDPEAIANILEFCHSRRPSIYGFEAQLRKLQVPTLIALGDEDAPCMRPALFLQRTIPASGLWIWPRSGHAINLEEPAEFNHVVERFIHAVQSHAWGPRDSRTAGMLAQHAGAALPAATAP